MQIMFLLLCVVGYVAHLLWSVYCVRRAIEQAPPAPPPRPSRWHESQNIPERLTALLAKRQVTETLTRSVRWNGAHETAHVLRPVASTPHDYFRLAQLLHGAAPDLTMPVEVASVTVDVGPPIAFKTSEPRRLATYHGQPHITQILDVALRAMESTDVVLPHKLLTGLPGFGKTLLAKVLTNELQHRAQQRGLPPVGFVETYAANLNSVQALDQAVQAISQHQACVWFIDELHVLNNELATKIYLLMEEGRYPFNGSLNPTALPPVMVIGATTDYGQLHPALKRRFGEALMMRPLKRADLLKLAQGVLPSATAAALERLVTPCVYSGAPHELKTLARDVETYAKANAIDPITPAVVETVCQLWEIDDHGLRPIDRQVMAALYQRPKWRAKDGELLGYGASEADVCAVTGLDRGEFQAVVRPRLMSRGYIEIRSGFGIRLTERAMTDYPQEAVTCAS